MAKSNAAAKKRSSTAKAGPGKGTKKSAARSATAPAARSKKTAAKKTAAKKTAAKKTAAKKTAAKQTAAKKTGGKKGGGKKGVKRLGKVDAALFCNLTEGEQAAALRLLIEDKRLANMAKVGRYRLIGAEPLVVKPPHDRHGHRLAGLVVYDYASDRCVIASVDLDDGEVFDLNVNNSQPMLAREEEAAAIRIAIEDSRVQDHLGLGDEPLAAMHYWSWRDKDVAYRRRSAAVMFGREGARPALVAVVDLIDNQVTEVVHASQW